MKVAELNQFMGTAYNSRLNGKLIFRIMLG